MHFQAIGAIVVFFGVLECHTRDLYEFSNGNAVETEISITTTPQKVLKDLDDDNFIETWSKTGSLGDKLGSLRSYNRRRKPPDYYDNRPKPQTTRFLKEFLKKTSTFLSLSEFLQSNNLTLVDFLKKNDREVKELLLNKPLFIIPKDSTTPVKKNKLALKPKIGIVNTDKKTVQPDNDIVTKLMLNETSFDNAMVRSEIYEVFSNSDKRDSLLRILDELNMTLNDLIEHRERGSSQTHLSDIFHRSVKEPDVRDRNLIVEKVHFNMKDISNQQDEESTETSPQSRDSFLEPLMIPIPKNTVISSAFTSTTPQFPSPSSTSTVNLPNNVQNALLASLSIFLVSLIIFLSAFVICKRNQIQRRRLLSLNSDEIFTNHSSLGQKKHATWFNDKPISDYGYQNTKRTLKSNLWSMKYVDDI